MPDPMTVSNSSCLIALDLVGRLDLLHDLYGTVLVPCAVSYECGSSLPSWIRVQPIQNQGMARSLQIGLGAGESEAIVLATETSAVRLILDDKKARHIAQQLGLPITGTLAVLLRAKQQRLIPNLCDVLDDLAAVDFRISDALVEDALRRAGEYIFVPAMFPPGLPARGACATPSGLAMGAGSLTQGARTYRVPGLRCATPSA